MLLLIRIQKRTWPNFVNVAETTYGVYLIHAIVIDVVFAAAAHVLYAHDHVYGPVSVLLIWAVLAPIAYFLSLQFTQALGSIRGLGWAVGATNPAQRSATTDAVSTSEAVTQTEQSLGSA